MNFFGMFKKNKQNYAAQITDTGRENNQVNPLMNNLQRNLVYIRQSIGNSTDIHIREFDAGKNGQIHFSVIYTEGLIDTHSLNNNILESLLLDLRNNDLDFTDDLKTNTLKSFKRSIIPIGDIKDVSAFEELFYLLLSGYAILLADGISTALALNLRSWVDRGVNEPSSETVIRGPKDGFTETLRTNTTLVRRRIRDPNLWIETLRVGRRTQTDVAVAYIKGVASDKVVEKVHQRIDSINIDGILDSGYIEELIQDAPFSPFPTVYNTERPDKIAAGLLEGRVAIFVDGTPFVLMVPVLFIQFFQAAEDYYHHFLFSSLIRILRFMSFFFALIVPAAYLAVTTFHQEMVPTAFITSVAAKREGLPFPELLEVLLMEGTFEILREAGIRLPRAVGQTVSIVGVLVIGQTAVTAGIVSPMLVIVVSFTAISNFVIPVYSMAMSVRILRFIMLILASVLGLFGIVLGLILMVLHLCSLESFGVPYMSPMAPMLTDDQKDTLVRLPRFRLLKRPHYIPENNEVRGRNF